MKIRSALVIVTVTLFVSACGGSKVAATKSPTITPSEVPSQSASPNDVSPTAAKAYRKALELSLASAQSTGLTELWRDSSGSLVTVVAQAAHDGICAQADLVTKDTQVIDSAGMMPSVLLDELAGLENNSGTDTGSVTVPKAGTFVVKNFVEDIHYVTVYTTDSEGRIATAAQQTEGDASATATFTYSLTAEGKKAISDVK